MKAKNVVVLFLLVLGIPIVGLAQKLPTKQDSKFAPPIGVKVDGKTSEWGNFQAYNPATEISYTIANDDEKLYFACSATIEEVIQKILLGGITLTISHLDKKAGIPPVSITFPIVPFAYVQVNYDLRQSVPLEQSTLSLLNKKISGHLKEIKITGVKEYADGLISVYNDEGIVGAHYIESNKVYTYELAFPLRLITHLINDQNTFHYKVQVNGMDTKKTIVVGGSNGPSAEPSDRALPHGALYDMSPTYFNSTYTLVKK